MAIILSCGSDQSTAPHIPLRVATEFSHCICCACVAYEKGWYQKEGFEIKTYQSYVTGEALSSALGGGYIDVAYVGLIPAIEACSTGTTPLKIVSGIYRYGYGLVARPGKLKNIKDLETEHTSIGCSREGSGADVFLQKTIEAYRLDSKRVIRNIVRMKPHQMLIALRKGELDAVFVPEHRVSMAEGYGFKTMLTCKDVPPCIFGAVLVVKESLIKENPEAVRRLVHLNRRTIDYIKSRPADAAIITSRHLSLRMKQTAQREFIEKNDIMEITPEMCLLATKRVEYNHSIDKQNIQEAIDCLTRLKFIKKPAKAEDIVETRFLD